jgi:hypothetical protein
MSAMAALSYITGLINIYLQIAPVSSAAASQSRPMTHGGRVSIRVQIEV